MRLVITTNQGEVVEIIEDIEDYDLSNNLAVSELVNQITQAVKVGRQMEGES